MILRIIRIITLILLSTQSVSAQSMSAYQIVEKAHNNRFFSNFQAQADMTIYRPTWKRSIGIKTWLKSREMAMLLIVSPPKEKGESYLKIGNNIWNWQPVIERTVKIALAATGTPWHGSDFTIDDMLKSSSFLYDCNHELVGKEVIDGDLCYKLILTPHSESTILWNKVVVWISDTSFVERKIEYYDEDDILIRTYTSDNIQIIQGHFVPLHFEVIPADKKGYKTVLSISDCASDPSIKESFFSLQNMKRLN